MIDYENLTPEQRKEAKEQEQGEIVRSIYIQEGKYQVAIEAIKEGLNDEIIEKLTGLGIDRIRELRKKQKGS